MKKLLQLDFKRASIEEGSSGKQVIEYDKELLPLYTRNLDKVLEDIEEEQELQLKLNIELPLSQFRLLTDFLVDCSDLNLFDLQIKSVEQDS